MGDFMSRNVTGWRMIGEPRAAIIDAEVVDVPSTSVELVPLSANPDASFVAQLIATAEQAPQTCRLRRGSCADAQAAYVPHVGERRSVTRRTKQII